jgi:hypothetical protein
VHESFSQITQLLYSPALLLEENTKKNSTVPSGKIYLLHHLFPFLSRKYYCLLLWYLQKIYLLYHPPSLSTGENTNIFYRDSENKNTSSFAASFCRRKYYTTFSMPSLGKTCFVVHHLFNRGALSLLRTLQLL